ncbi:MAG: hypothetical protein PGN25_19115 [Methylorubrum populi]
MSKSVLPEIRAAMEPWLAACIVAWQAQPVATREPTLPTTRDGKVNVKGVGRALGLRESQVQHLFRYAELRAALNAVAVEQGLKPIGTRSEADEVDKAVAARLKQVEARSGELSKVVAPSRPPPSSGSVARSAGTGNSWASSKRPVRCSARSGRDD